MGMIVYRSVLRPCVNGCCKAIKNNYYKANWINLNEYETESGRGITGVIELQKTYIEKPKAELTDEN